MNLIPRLTACFVAPVSLVLAASWTPPTPPQLARLDRALAPSHAQYDPTEHMLRRPFSSPGYHTTLTGGFVHSTRDSLAYAVGLLDTGRATDLDRAIEVIRRVVALQDSDPTSKTYGIWSWFLEEPLARMSPPDFNWADFNGVSLLQIARDHRERLPADLARAVDNSILYACRAIKQRNVGPSYTNIAIMGTYVTLVAGELYELPEFKSYGLDRLRRFYDYTHANGAFEEYNSPTYTLIALYELSRLKAHVRSLEAQPMIDALVSRAWEEIATHFHSPTRQWAGPHSRAYTSLNRSAALAAIQRGTAGRVQLGADDPDREELRLPLACPAHLEPLFGPLTTPRTVTETFIKRTETVGTSFLHPKFALGSVNHGDLWNQRRPLLLHFGSTARPGYVQLRFLKNNYDFSSAIFTGTQREGLVLGAVHLVTDGGDTHISLDKVKAGKIRARDLRLRFEIGGPAAQQVRTTTQQIKTPDLDISIRFARARFDGHEAQITTGGDGSMQWVDAVFYNGPDREFDLAALDEAFAAFAFCVGTAIEPTLKLEAGQATVTAADLSLVAPLKPAPRR
ncbi:MAG: hypothetical protein WCG63_09250 [Opitutaceae bacterium]